MPVCRPLWGADLPLRDSSIHDVYAQASTLLMGAKYVEAMTFLDELIRRLKLAPLDKSTMDAASVLEWAIYHRGIVFLETGKPDQGIAALDDYLKKYPAGQFRKFGLFLIPETLAIQEKWDEAAKRIAAALPEFRTDRTLLAFGYNLLGEARFHAENWEEALEPLLWVFRQHHQPEARIRAAAKTVTCLVQLDKFKELFEFLPIVERTAARYDVIMNVTLVEGGDLAYQEKRFDMALWIHQFVLSKEEIQQELNRAIADAKNNLTNLPPVSGVFITEGLVNRQRLERLLRNLEAQAARLKEIPDYEQELTMRLGQSHAALHRYWEALVLFRSIYDDHPEHPLAERGLYSAMAVAFEMKNIPRGLKEGYDYVEAYPKGQFWDTVTMQLTQTHIERQEWEQAIAIALKGITINPDHLLRDQMTFLIGYSHFMLEQFQEAQNRFAEVRDKYPKSIVREMTDYWYAMPFLYQNRYKEARTWFLDFRARWPASEYSEDACYRLGVAEYGDGDYAAATKTFREFLAKFPRSEMRSDAFSIIGDMCAFQSDLDHALESYAQARASTSNMVPYSYATFQPARVLELEQRYEEIIQLMQGYLARWGEQGSFTEATYWIGSAQKRLNRPADALQTFCSAIVRYGNLLPTPGIDMIIRDLAYETGQAFDAEIRYGYMERLRTELEQARQQRKAVLELRLTALFAESATDPIIRARLVTPLLRESIFTNASPIVLNLIGRDATARGNRPFALKAYQYLLTRYNTSELALDAYKALAELRMAAGQYELALPHLCEITSRFAASDDAPWAQKSIGDAYRLLKRYPEAIAAYNTVLGVKDWRGPLWPEALYWIGICHLAQGAAREAFPFFQRVYVMYEGHAAWSAKAYLQSAECLVQLKQPADAARTCEEFIGKETLAQLPEAKAARELLRQLRGGA
ncbi:MAG: tetratricopeptide repeat protein [Kiritimatiellaeota bacterium]|nr:tetratricopeptide repeat protein [Kiritimatiellota bacterium]